MIHSIDSEKLIERISPDREVFLQVNLDPDGQSNSRAGIDPKDLEDFSRMMVARFAGNFLGLMAVAPHFAGITTSQIGESFERLKVLSRKVQEIAPNAKAISAGMSDDYRLALEHGATHIRLGSSILGQRTPNT